MTTLNYKWILILFITGHQLFGQTDFIKDDSFTPMHCIGAVWDMVLLPSDEVLVCHTGISHYCTGVTDFSWITLLSQENGQINTGFNAPTAPPPYTGFSVLDNDIYLNQGAGRPIKFLSDGSIDQSWYSFSTLYFDSAMDIEWMSHDSSIIWSGSFFIENDPNIKPWFWDRRIPFVKFNKDGQLDHSNFNPPVILLISDRDTIYMNESHFISKFHDNSFIFSTRGNIADDHRSDYGIFIMNNDGSIDTDFATSSDIVEIIERDPISKFLTQEDGKIVIFGRFKIDYQDQELYTGMLRLHPNGDIDTTFNFQNNVFLASQQPDPRTLIDQIVYDGLLLENDTMVFVGSFNQYQGFERGGVVMTDKDGNIVPGIFDGEGFKGEPFKPHGEGRHQLRSVAAPDSNTLFIGGYYSSFNGVYNSKPPGIIKLIR